MKKLICLALALGMMTSAFSCGEVDDEDKSPKTSASEKDEPEDTSGEEETEAEETEEEETTAEETEAETEEETTEAPAETDDGRMAAFEQAISHIYYAAEEPLTEMDLSDPDYMISDDQFAVFDVDKDGLDELVFLHTATCMAGMAAFIYDVDESGELCLKVTYSPFLHFWSNGVITADASHNHSQNYDFWPYTVFEYDGDSGLYFLTYDVSAWSKEQFPTGYDGESFPDDTDADGNGVVYYIRDCRSEEDAAATAGPVDDAAYDEWHESVFNGADEEKPLFYALTEENIDIVFVEGSVG